MPRAVVKLFAVLALCAFAAPALAASDTSAGRLSGNWAGYVAARGEYSAIGAAWAVPTVAATTTLMGDVTWVGIGGSRTRDLIQVGTQGMVQSGATQYWAWYELLPDYQQRIPMAVHAGDRISASLIEISDGLWLVSVSNASTGEQFYKTVEYRSRRSSAEWIEEMPTVYGKSGTQLYAPLSEFGTAAFSGAFVIVDGEYKTLDDARASATTMVAKNNKRLTLAAPSDVAAGGFTVARTDAVPSPSGARHAKASEIVWTKP